MSMDWMWIRMGPFLIQSDFDCDRPCTQKMLNIFTTINIACCDLWLVYYKSSINSLSIKSYVTKSIHTLNAKCQMPNVSIF